MQQHDKEQNKSNKRAQRPWVAHLRKRSKGHSGAIYRGPLMLSTKYWSRTSRWCYTSNIKALGLVLSDKKIFENCILKTYFLTPWPTYATNWNGLNNLVEEHLGIIPVMFGQNSTSGFREEVVWMKKLTHLRTAERRTVTKAHSEHFVLRWAKNSTKKRDL